MEEQIMNLSEVNGHADGVLELTTTLDRLADLTATLEQTLERLTGMQGITAADAEACIGRVVATVEARREAELEQKLLAAEAEIAELRGAAQLRSRQSNHVGGRKTMPATMVSLLAKQGVTLDSMEASALDAAMVSLSVEQRIAVKAELMRAGLLG